MKTIRILILEDDLETLSLLLKKLHLLEEDMADSDSLKDFSIVTLSEYTQVEEFINKSSKIDFDVILLDRDCKAGGSFHVLDIERFGADKIISISSVPDYNEEAMSRGITSCFCTRSNIALVTSGLCCPLYQLPVPTGYSNSP